MKNYFNSKRKPPPIALLIFLFLFTFKIMTAQPGNYSARYANPSNATWTYNDNVVVTRLIQTSAFSNQNGFVIFKTNYNPSTFLSDLIIHVVRDDGTLLGTRRLELTNSHAVPIACAYNEANLLSWSTNQSNTIYYYPRWNNFNLPVQYYNNGYNYDQIWYPSHHSIDLDFNAYNTIQQGLTGIDDGNNEVVLNLTDNAYDLSSCEKDEFNVGLSLISVGESGFNTVAQQSPNISHANIPYNYTTLNNPNVDICGNPFMFKTNPIEIDNEKNISYSDDLIIINVNQNDTHFSVYDISGKLLYSDKINYSNITINKSRFSSGLYFVKIYSSMQNSTIIKKILMN